MRYVVICHWRRSRDFYDLIWADGRLAERGGTNAPTYLIEDEALDALRHHVEIDRWIDPNHEHFVLRVD